MTQTPFANVFRTIVERRRDAVAEAKATRPQEVLSDPRLEDDPTLITPAKNPFLSALARRRGSGIIAEIKLGSPKLGSLVGTFDPQELALEYAASGAACLSVVTEPDYFFGSYEILEGCKWASGLPTIAKDFVVDEIQFRWASDAGADAVLLIAALYSKEELHRLAKAARRLNLVPLVEIHGLGELTKLEGGNWELVGVNNRDLRTFEVVLDNSIALASTLPTGAIKVAESGLNSASEIAMLRGVGYDAFLIGEALITSPDPGGKLRELLG
jgi:indole-3-glycerol phosphate synthase